MRKKINTHGSSLNGILCCKAATCLGFCSNQSSDVLITVSMTILASFCAVWDSIWHLTQSLFARSLLIIPTLLRNTGLSDTVASAIKLLFFHLTHQWFATSRWFGTVLGNWWWSGDDEAVHWLWCWPQRQVLCMRQIKVEGKAVLHVLRPLSFCQIAPACFPSV